jgi:nucleoside-diphosphate-sugar epimerase
VRLAAEICGISAPILPVPEDILRQQASWYRPPFAHRFVLDTTRIKGELDFRPTPMERWLEDTVRWHLAAGLPPSADYDRRADERTLARRWEERWP